eukprot:CAMPEP_0202892662 /NCGR_PEP_ID=MMETSP1392-20130828/2377_1 /ASSEMBLY_ACC=CAM_ASM_000868 /TAXON_ID=225041 /ORGANISM="Chlamydomonas chlamydogama, Strain SAG 11-48b" /LENGTH=108 /DNA_ID=CAMNT_0049576705 /DNA_START=177 /DNA_END=503 /DNA_ORIENTATION=-
MHAEETILKVFWLLRTLPNIDDQWRLHALNAMEDQTEEWVEEVVEMQNDPAWVKHMFDAAIARSKRVPAYQHDPLVDAVHHFLSGIIKPLLEIGKRKPSSEVGKRKPE